MATGSPGQRGYGFKPTQINGCVLWLRADQGVSLDGSGNVQSWSDLSGNGNTFSQATAGKCPAYLAAGGSNSQSAVSFNGANALTNGGNFGISTLGWTILAIVQFGSATPGAFTFFLANGDSGGNNGIELGSSSANNRIINYRGSATCSDGPLTTNWEAWGAVQTSAPLTTLYVNSTSASQALDHTTNVPVAFTGGSAIGQQVGGVGSWTGKVAEVLAYNQALTQYQVSFLFQYFAARYNPGAWS